MSKKQFSIQTELTAKIDDLTAKLNTANQRINRFKNDAQKGKTDVFSSLTGNLGKLLPAIGVAGTALTVFNGVINTTKKAGDDWAMTKSTMTSALDHFYRTLASGKWYNFIDNLKESVKVGQEFQKWLNEVEDFEASVTLKTNKAEVYLTQLQKDLKQAVANKDWNLVIEIEAKISEVSSKKFNEIFKQADRDYNEYMKVFENKTGLKRDEIMNYLYSYSNDSFIKLRKDLEEYKRLWKEINDLEKQINDPQFKSRLTQQQYDVWKSHIVDKRVGLLEELYEKYIPNEKNLEVLKKAYEDYRKKISNLNNELSQDLISQEEYTYNAQALRDTLNDILIKNKAIYEQYNNFLEGYNLLSGEDVEKIKELDTKITQARINSITETSRAEIAAINAKKQLEEETEEERKKRLKGEEDEKNKILGILEQIQKEEKELEEQRKTANVNELARINEQLEYLSRLKKFYNNLKPNQIEPVNNISNPVMLTINPVKILPVEEAIKKSIPTVKALKLELNELINKQQELSTNSEQWNEWGLRIEEVQQKINSITGEMYSNVDTFYLYSDSLYSIANSFDALSYAANSFGNETASGIFSIISASLQFVNAMAEMNRAIAQQATLNAVNQASKLPFPANIASIASVLGLFMSTFATIKNIGRFETGGIVGGSSFSGDKVLARVNSGEMILNAGQQKNLFKMINEGKNNSISGTVTVKGSDLVIALDNHNKRLKSYK